MDRILIIRLSSLGDIIHTLPSFASLRKNFPRAVIRWAVEEKGKEILDLVPGLDEVVIIDKRNWRQSLTKIRGRDQVALDFQGLVKSGLLAYLSRARRRIGFPKRNLKEPWASLFYTERPDPVAEEEGHVISKNLRILERLGIKETNYDFPIRVPDEISRSLQTKLGGMGCGEKQRLVVFNVGAGWETKRWFPDEWAETINRAEIADAFSLLLWGNEDEKRLAEEVASKTDAAVAPFFSIMEVIALIRSASLLVSGDTFALQVACALDVPVVAFFGPTNPLRNGPFRSRDKVLFHKQDCNPCYKKTCPTLECLRAITPNEAAAAIKEQWSSHG
ncbi:MAG: glycosyltransferase family 9 protein [Candidatus Aminicenantes bacterium]|nr:glycosyltransferase family 9 protein [Candidatus Aminicenantes bacterium]